MTTKRGTVKESTTKTKSKANLIKKATYQGKIESIEGKHICIVKDQNCQTIHYVRKSRLKSFKKRMGANFIRVAGQVKTDYRPLK